MTQNQYEGQATLTPEISAVMAITQLHSFSCSHGLTAAYLARRARELESEPSGEELRACSTAAVVMAAAFLEATANEFFATCRQRAASPGLARLAKAKVALAGQLWEFDVPRTARYPILDKYRVALRLFDASLDFGKAPAQEVQILVSIRNALVHAEPAEAVTHSDIDEMPVTVSQFEEKTRGKFDLNPHKGPGDAFFPDRLLSAGCAGWAVNSAVAFADEFFETIGASPPYQDLRAQLKV